jgi:hypothetical protein
LVRNLLDSDRGVASCEECSTLPKPPLCVQGAWSSLGSKTAESVARNLARIGGVGAGSLVLDVGSGCGSRLAGLCRAFGARGVGVDVAGGLVRWANERWAPTGAAFCPSDPARLEWLPAAKFDVALSVGVLHRLTQTCRLRCARDGSRCEAPLGHSDCGGPCSAIRAMARATRAGGVVIVDHLDGSFPRSAWPRCLAGTDVDFLTLPSHRLHAAELGGSSPWGEAFYALIVVPSDGTAAGDAARRASAERVLRALAPASVPVTAARPRQFNAAPGASVDRRERAKARIESVLDVVGQRGWDAPVDFSGGSLGAPLQALAARAYKVWSPGPGESARWQAVYEFDGATVTLWMEPEGEPPIRADLLGGFLLLCDALPGHWHGTGNPAMKVDGACGARLHVAWRFTVPLARLTPNVDSGEPRSEKASRSASFDARLGTSSPTTNARQRGAAARPDLERGSFALYRTIKGPMTTTVDALGGQHEDYGTLLDVGRSAEGHTSFYVPDFSQHAYYELGIQMLERRSGQRPTYGSPSARAGDAWDRVRAERPPWEWAEAAAEPSIRSERAPEGLVPVGGRASLRFRVAQGRVI